MKKRIGIKLGDILLMLLLVIIAASAFCTPLFKPASKTAEIFFAQSGRVQIIPLDVDKEYDVVGGEINLVVSVKDGEISVLYSTCRDEICKNTPPISRPGQSIVCAPAGVIVRISGEGATVDGISG